MKASEVLEQYAKGKRDFQGVDLKGQSFQGKNLAGADFSEADIRGVNFGNAKLQKSKFINVTAGLPNSRRVVLVIISLLLSGLSSIFPAFTAIILSLFAEPTDPNSPIFAAIGLTMLAIFFFFNISKGLLSGLAAITITAIVAGVAGFIFAITIKGVDVGTAYWVFAFIAVFIILPISASVAVASAIAFSGAVAGKKAAVFAIFLVSFLAAILQLNIAYDERMVLVLLVGIGLTLVSAYVGLRAVTGDSKQAFIWKIAVAFASQGGTNFSDANLTDADFSSALLRNSDLRKADITRTYWHEAKRLNNVRLGETYLSNEKIRKLAITCNGQNLKFDNQNLRGINLRNANLEKATFIDVNFNEANLQGANLSKAILVRTQFERADLRGACLTGSCIQDWVITKETKLDGIVCDYVFLKWIDGDKRDQMPPRGKFKEGAFVLFVKYILETIKIYHDKDINPRLALSILKKMSRDYDEPLDIVAVGKRGERVFVKVRLSEKVEQERFKQDYYSRYNKGLKLVSSNPKQLPSVDELVENKIIEIASEKIPDDNQPIQVTHVEYIMSGNFGVGVNEGQIIADTIAGAINEE